MSDIVRLNVGGKQFHTSRHTLLWSGNSFFSSLLDGQLPSSKDETGSYFIDRDPELFSIILNYLRSGEVNRGNADLGSLKNEALFYGLDSLVKKLSFCEENFRGVCGDLLFHVYIPPPEFPCDDNTISSSPSSKPDCGTSSNGSSTPRPRSEAVTLRNKHPSQSASTLPNRFATTHEESNDKLSPGTTSRQTSSNPVTLMTCYQNVMAVVYKDYIGIFHLKDPTGWRLAWMSPRLPAPVDRVAVTMRNTNVFSPTPGSSNSSFSFSGGAHQFAGVQQFAPGNSREPSVAMYGPSSSDAGAVGVNSAVGGNSMQPSPTVTSESTQSPTSVCLVACAIGSTIILWSLYPPLSMYSSTVVLWGSSLGVAMTPASSGLSPLFLSSSHLEQRPMIRLREPWAHDLVGHYDLNGRAVDYLVFIDAHLVALSRLGLVGVRHTMTNTWQVWSTVPILSYSVAASELLLLGCANGRIYSINIQKFPLRIVDNDLLITEMYRDPLQDPVTALSMHFVKSTSDRLGCVEIAYGTLSGRVGLIVQYPENVAFSPQLLQTFAVHRSMVTRVVLSEKHLISVCSESNHVRTWAVTRFRGVISTHPGCIPTASFHVIALDTSSPQTMVDSVTDLVRTCLIPGTKTSGHQQSSTRSTVICAHSNVTTTTQEHSQNRTQPDTASTPQPQPQQQQSRQQQHRIQRSCQPFRFANWRRHIPHSRSPVVPVSESRHEDSESAQPRTERVSSPPTDSAHPDAVSAPAGANQRPSCVHTLSAAPGGQSDLFILPRTSWLHEDRVDLNRRTGRRSCDVLSDENQNNMPRVCMMDSRSSGSYLGRCQTFHGATNNSCSPSINMLPTLGSRSRDLSAPKSLIELHRYANDPGPYGEREDVLLFIQKVTPSANQLFVRLASTGKRVCVIRSVDDTPISAFWVHEHDGCNRIGAHPRRYLFTGHTDGSIQVWDLTTALNAHKLSNGRESVSALWPGLHVGGFPADFSTSMLLSQMPGIHAPGVHSPATFMPTIGQSSVLPGPTAVMNSGGGPTSQELLHQLESCQLGTSSSIPSDSTLT